MGEGDFKNTLSAFILISLFGMLIVSAVISVGNTYGKNTSEVVGGSLALQGFNDSISDLESSTQSMYKNFNEGNIWSAVAGVVVEGIFGLTKTMFNFIIAPFTIISNILQDILGVPSYVTTVLLGLLILSIIFGIWRILKIGE